MRIIPEKLVDTARKAQPSRWFGRFDACAAVALIAVGCSSSNSSDGGTGGKASAQGGSNSIAGAGGARASGGVATSGGVSSSTGGSASGGTAQTGGQTSAGASARGGASTGGSGPNGGSTASGGRGGAGNAGSSSGGASTGGSGPKGGSTASGGTSRGGAGDGGSSSGGGGQSGGGKAASGGTGNPGGAGGAGGGSTNGPCDIYAAANTPCVAAHSTVRALYAAYSGNLYQLRRGSDKTTKDVPVKGAGGFVDISVQDTFCTGTTCTISIIYDQTTNHNDLTKSPQVTYVTGTEANATDGKVTVSGNTAYGIYVTGNPNYVGKNPPISNVAYRNNSAKGLAKGDQAESMYMVLDGKRFSSVCCFDYGNAETSGRDDGDATMEAIYWGSDTQWAKGGGNGPWIAGDLENGMYKGDSKNTPSNTSITGMSYVTAILKGPAGNHFGLKAGNAQSGKLEVKWDGARPPGYSPMKKQGAIILGTGGDGSPGGTGTFYEGAITSGNPPDATDDAIQANIVAAGYGH